MRDRQKLLELAGTLNSKIVTLPRIEILGLLADMRPEGGQYRELKAQLAISDGKLISNLNILEEMGYIESDEVTVENKTLTSYVLTNEGQEAWAATQDWLLKWLAKE